jgi:ankyrin repeat protein
MSFSFSSSFHGWSPFHHQPERGPYFKDNNNEIIEAIITDDSATFATLVFENTETMDQVFGFDTFFVPRILSSAPPLISVCAFFKAVNCLQLLLDAGASLKKEDLLDKTPIFFAVASGSLEIVRMVDVDSDTLQKVDKEGNLPIHFACEFGFCDAINYIYTKGHFLQLSASNSLRQVPLLLAAENGHLSVLELLNSIGVNLLDSDGRGWNALHYACKGGYADVTGWLIDHGIGIDRTTHESETPLVIAAQSGSLVCVKLLVERGSVQVKVTNRKHVPIVSAAEAGHVDIVRYLESIGVSRYSTTSTGISAVTIAQRMGQNGVIEYFKSSPKK